jgi:hypothetical protein
MCTTRSGAAYLQGSSKDGLNRQGPCSPLTYAGAQIVGCYLAWNQGHAGHAWYSAPSCSFLPVVQEHLAACPDCTRPTAGTAALSPSGLLAATSALHTPSEAHHPAASLTRKARSCYLPVACSLPAYHDHIIKSCSAVLRMCPCCGCWCSGSRAVQPTVAIWN